MLTSGGPVLAAPVLQSITFAGYDQQSQVDDFVAKVGATAYWHAAVGEYGVGAATVQPPVHLSTAPPSNPWDDSQIQSWLAQQVGSNSAFMQPSQNALYVIFVPSSTTVTLQGSNSCQAFGGYHNSTTVNGQQVAYAVVPECSYPPMTTLQTTTGSASHELAEASTDPLPLTQTPAYDGVDQDHAVWELALGGGEVGDMCARFPGSFFQPSGFGYTVQRIWSNASVKVGKDPCQPELAGETYVGAVPLLSDAVTISDQGQSIQTKGVQIAQGQSKTVPVQLYSEGPIGPFTVAARDLSQSGTNLSFSWNQTTGQNGDVLQLTITVNAIDSQFGGDAFVVESAAGSNQGFWLGYVGQ